ncbi:hypothetical protein AMECASPLE_030556 [Ameca splendens]|uniref:Uncharacterized protein n=1 Tax=Ameca splendens TaxID=208324 RepID=A0ABV0Z3Y4_9TELE
MEMFCYGRRVENIVSEAKSHEGSCLVFCDFLTDYSVNYSLLTRRTKLNIHSRTCVDNGALAQGLLRPQMTEKNAGADKIKGQAKEWSPDTLTRRWTEQHKASLNSPARSDQRL